MNLKHMLTLFCGVMLTLTLSLGAHCQQEPLTKPSGDATITPIQVPASKPVRFIAFGDSGSGLAGQKRLAAEMVRQYAKQPFAFALMLGDNIYPDGDVGKYGKERFTDPYRPLLEKGVRFWPALGNHDVDSGFRDAQIAFFKMPGAYYDFMADNIHFFVLDTNRFDSAQREWLAKRLSASHAKWKIVYGHHPMYSSGLHGSNTMLQQTLKPLLESHHVDLYLAGHDHDYERFAPKNGVLYIVSGGGGASLRKISTDRFLHHSSVRLSTYHFLRFEAQENALRFDAIDTNGQIIDSGRMLKPAQGLKPAA